MVEHLIYDFNLVWCKLNDIGETGERLVPFSFYETLVCFKSQIVTSFFIFEIKCQHYILKIKRKFIQFCQALSFIGISANEDAEDKLARSVSIFESVDIK